MNLNLFLSSIDFKLRKLDLRFSLLDILIRHTGRYWGVSLLKISSGDVKNYSFFEFIFCIPNGTNIQTLYIHSIDMFFMKWPIRKFLENHHENKLWTTKRTIIDKLLDQLYKI